jgi:uncharacterized protein (DUF58 family)
VKKKQSSSAKLPAQTLGSKPRASITVSLEELVRLKADAHGFSFLPRQPVSSLLSGRHASRLRGRGLAFEELRQYVQGDDVRTIDWKATARLRSPHVRVYNEERERPVLIVVDQRSSMFFGSRRAMKSVTAAEVAALAAWRALGSGDRIGGIVFNDQEIVELRPHRSQTRVLGLLHEIVRSNQALVSNPPLVDTAKAEANLNQALAAALRRANHDHLVVLVSDLDGADQETRRLATLLAAHNDVLVVAIYDPLGASLQGQPGMVATDRGKTYVLPQGAGFADTFQKEFATILDHWRSVFRALQIPILPLSTAFSPVDQLREIFGVRKHGGSGSS